MASVVGVGVGFRRLHGRAWTNGFVPRLDVRRMMEYASAFYRGAREGRWVIETRFRGNPWKVIVEPDLDRKRLVVVTVYSVEAMK